MNQALESEERMVAVHCEGDEQVIALIEELDRADPGGGRERAAEMSLHVLAYNLKR